MEVQIQNLDVSIGENHPKLNKYSVLLEDYHIEIQKITESSPRIRRNSLIFARTFPISWRKLGEGCYSYSAAVHCLARDQIQAYVL